MTLGASLRRYERCSGSSGIISTPTATQTSVTTQTRPGWSKTVPSRSAVGIPAAIQLSSTLPINSVMPNASFPARSFPFVVEERITSCRASVVTIDPLSSSTTSPVFCAPVLEWLDIVSKELEDNEDKGTSGIKAGWYKYT